MKKFLLAIFPLFFISFTAHTYSPNFKWLGSDNTFKIDPLTDGILFGTGVALNGTEFLLDNILDLNDKTFSSIPSKDTINSFDRYFIKDYSKTIDISSDVLVGFAFASPLLFSATNLKELPTITIMYLETLLLAKGTVDNLKFFASRTRPYMYYENYPKEFIEDGDWCKSWPSGHTTYTFATAAFLTYTFSKYNPDSNWKYVISGASYAIAISVGAMRIASGCHFATDVLTGAIIGTAWGFLVPYLHTLKVNNSSSLSITPAGFYLTKRL